MKTPLLLALLLTTTASAQTTLEQLRSDMRIERKMLTVESVAPDLFCITNTYTGEQVLKSTTDYPVNASVPNLFVDLKAVDTARYSSKYRFWNEIPVLMGRHGMLIGDLNRNNRKEIYGLYSEYGNLGDGVIYEYNPDSSFSKKYQFPDSILGGWAYTDIDHDSLYEVIHYVKTTKLWMGTQQSPTSLPTTFKSYYDTVATSGQPTYVNFYDINSDGTDELIYYMDGGSNVFPPGVQIANYNKAREKFEVVYFNKPNGYSVGFSFGDFDNDGKQNFCSGGIFGELFMYEHVSGNNYTVKLADTIPTKNAYMTCVTNDLDGNGKKELWRGGDFFYDGVGYTRLVSYESTGNDTYERRHQIDIKGAFSFFAGNMAAADMDRDGKQEIVLCVDQHVMIFKNTGGNNFELLYIKKNDLALSGANSVYMEVTVADFDNDGYPEIVVGMDEVKEYLGLRGFSRIYKFNTLTSVKAAEQQVPESFHLYQNYPNPFNGTTTIRYQIPDQSDVHISIYNILGKEILQTIVTNQAAGVHEYRWDAVDASGREIPSGVYFITVRTEISNSSIKMLLTK